MSGKYWDATWTLVDGCTPVSEGCANCWGRAMHTRMGGDFKPQLMLQNLDKPLHWKKPRIVAIWYDFFHPISRTASWFHYRVMEEIIPATPQHVYLVLTKRPESIVGSPKPNLWFGVTVESAKHIDRARTLCDAWPGHKYVSYEPALAPITDELRPWLGKGKIEWVIAGAETGAGRRECDYDWLLEVENICNWAHVPLWVKAGWPAPNLTPRQIPPELDRPEFAGHWQKARSK